MLRSGGRIPHYCVSEGLFLRLNVGGQSVDRCLIRLQRCDSCRSCNPAMIFSWFARIRSNLESIFASASALAKCTSTLTLTGPKTPLGFIWSLAIASPFI